MDGLRGGDLSALLASVVLDLGYKPSDQWLTLACLRSMELGLPTKKSGGKAFTPTALVDFASAMAACTYIPPQPWTLAFVNEAIYHPDGFTSDQAARILHAASCFQAR